MPCQRLLSAHAKGYINSEISHYNYEISSQLTYSVEFVRACFIITFSSWVSKVISRTEPSHSDGLIFPRMNRGIYHWTCILTNFALFIVNYISVYRNKWSCDKSFLVEMHACMQNGANSVYNIVQRFFFCFAKHLPITDGAWKWGGTVLGKALCQPHVFQGCRYNPSVFRIYQVLLLVLTTVQCLIDDIMQQGVQNLDVGRSDNKARLSPRRSSSHCLQ